MLGIKVKTALVLISLAFSGHAAMAAEAPADKLAAARLQVDPAVLAKSSEAQRDAWRHQLIAAPRPDAKACYRAVYPDTAWREIPCTKPPKHYFPPKATVGGGSTNDWAADPPNPIIQAEGSFDAANATSANTINAGAGGTNGSDLWSLQLNTADFDTSVCPASASGCQGFVQFVYDQTGDSAFVQYWLINPPATCPGAWQPFEVWCVQTAASATSFSPAPTAADLKDIRVIGTSASGGEVLVYWNGAMQSAHGGGIIPDLASHWSEVEYNVFGDGGAGEVSFNAGTSITVRTQVDTGHNVLPSCIPASFTGETNNLDLVSTPAVVPKSQYPAIVFDESNASSTTASCSTSVGDPHITTFDGLYYNFYAAGEFVLADAGPDFIVQSRQESGAKVFNNPNVTMNTAVAVQMGTSRVAIYDSPARVELNGKTTALADGQVIDLPGGAYLWRVGSLYLVTKNTGEMVRAQLYNGWMDLEVGLGHRPRASAKGILASPSRTALSMRDGTRLAEPVSAADLYQRYARSWLVPAKESLFTDHPVSFAAPAKVFTAADLAPAAAAKARTACAAAGVTETNLLDSCIVDAAVLKDPVAIRAFAHAIVPKLAIRPVGPIALEH